MIKAKGEDFWIVGTEEELLEEFGGICLTFIHNGFEVNDLLNVINKSDDIYQDCKDEIIDIDDDKLGD